jgi:predicted peroxiredoxin
MENASQQQATLSTVSIPIALTMLDALGLSLSPASAQTTEKQKVVVHLAHYTDHPHAVKMAVYLAHMMQTTSAEVTLLLDAEGVRLASSKEPQDVIWGKDSPISVEYGAFVKAGGRVPVCPDCADNASIKERDLRSGAHIRKKAELAKAILAAHNALDY